MLVRAPRVEAEQDRSIRIEDLAKAPMGGVRDRRTKQSLVAVEAAANVVHPDDRPRTLHRNLLGIKGSLLRRLHQSFPHRGIQSGLSRERELDVPGVPQRLREVAAK